MPHVAARSVPGELRSVHGTIAKSLKAGEIIETYTKWIEFRERTGIRIMHVHYYWRHDSMTAMGSFDVHTTNLANKCLAKVKGKACFSGVEIP